MNVTPEMLLAYSTALLVLIIIPGPVVAAIVARAVSGGFRLAWPLAAGVVTGDILWPLLAMLGLAALVQLHAEILTILRWSGAAFFIWMGIGLLRGSAAAIDPSEAALKGSGWDGFVAGVLIIAGNAKAILFYLAILPGFFPMDRLHWTDMAVIIALSGAIPLAGNLAWAAAAARARTFLRSPAAIRRVNLACGASLILVGLAIPFL